ncbi:MAG: 2Fe-2S iron-sulfur cluster binding domain-containing protein [Spirochaetes bacterium]|jgi:carbon-monoxide dehydrogenase small subunit|nr:2Fe-2S iron-sulfur cluster binding domain-containing protein [Spirochaetota bacterium]
MKITFTLNGTSRTVEAEPLARLLDLLREDLGLTGTKEGCGEGECGACTVLMDGMLVASCLVPAAQADGTDISTIEGLGETEGGKLLADAFAEAHAVQCGFCTPGMMMAARQLLQHNPDPTEQEIRHAISGNICRCTGYDMIIDGIQLAARRARERARERGDEIW